MSYHCVTSMSIPIWSAYGHHMVSSWVQRWSDLDATLSVYFDDAAPPDFPASAVVQPLSLRQCVPALADFQLRHQSPICSGRFGSAYSYVHDAKKFAFKPAAISHALPKTSASTLIWLDADTLFKRPMAPAFLAKVFPRTATVGTFTRAWAHSECGIIFYNLHNPFCLPFHENVWSLYTSDRIFLLEGWTDCHAFDTLVKHFTTYRRGFSLHNLGTTDSHQTAHPLVNSPWFDYVDHLKGARKEAGASYPTDRIIT